MKKLEVLVKNLKKGMSGKRLGANLDRLKQYALTCTKTNAENWKHLNRTSQLNSTQKNSRYSIIRI
jgi:hypothetical protein